MTREASRALCREKAPNPLGGYHSEGGGGLGAVIVTYPVADTHQARVNGGRDREPRTGYRGDKKG